MLEEFGVDLSDRGSLEMALPRFMILSGAVADKGGDALIFGEFGLSVATYSLLMAMIRTGTPLSMTMLKDSIFIQRSSSNLTQLVDDLESRGLAKRLPSPTDRRVSLVEITGEGRKLIEEVEAQYASTMRDLLKEYTMEELQVAVQVMARFTMQTWQVLGLEIPWAAKAGKNS